MTVRWKPLVILSGLFLLVALIGVVAITLTLVPRSSQSFLRRARMAHDAGRFEEAEIDFKQALPARRQGRHDSRRICQFLSRLGQARSRRQASRALERAAQSPGERGQVR